MQNPILKRLSERQGVRDPDPVWLLTLLTVLRVDAYTLDDWNEALSAVMGRRVYCPSYRTLSTYLQRAVLGL